MKNRSFNKLFVILAIVTIATVPLFASALDFSKTLVPCGWDGAHKALLSGGVPNTDGVITPDEMCNFNDFVVVVGRIVNYAIIIVSVFAAIAFMFAGYGYLTAGGNQDAVSRSKDIFKKVLTGYIIILTAWLIVYTLEQAFYSGDPNARPGTFLNGGKPVNGS